MYKGAIGVLETRGMAALMAGVDAMLKAARVRLCGRHGIGSGWVTAVVEGEVAAVETALGAGGREARRYGDLVFAETIARPEERLAASMPHGAPGKEIRGGPRALGLLETQGLAPLMVGADAACKAAKVELAGWAFIGGALCHALLRGDVAAVRQAVEVGRRAAQRHGEVHASLVLPQPDAGLGPLLPPATAGQGEGAGALGVLETTGYVSAVAGADAMVKAAEVEIRRLSIGSGGRIAALAGGALDSVRAAMEAGAQAAEAAGELNTACVISRPDPGVMACFAGRAPGRAGAGGGRAMGLIETRSTVALVKAVDRMLKAAAVDYEGSYKVGYFLTASVVRGDVGAVRAAVEAGAAEAARYGELVSAHVIPQVFAEVEERLAHR